MEKFWNELKSKNFIKPSNYSGYYSVVDESFMSKNDLKYIEEENKYVTEQNQPVEYITEENYHIDFKGIFDKFKQEIENKNINFIPRNIINEVNEYINQNLSELSISRPRNRVSWGIPVPGEENQQTVYVWFEALINYLTILSKN